MIHCPNVEIAAAVGCSVDTLTDRYSELLDKGRSKGKASLRRIQWEAATKGNVVMMIWLGKQLLGQSDKMDKTISASGSLEITTVERQRIDDAKKMLQTMPNERSGTK